MSVVLDKLLSSREMKTVTKMMPANASTNPVKNCELKGVSRNKSNTRTKHAVSNTLKTGKNLEGKSIFSRGLKILPFEKNITLKKGVVRRNCVLPSLNSFESYLDLAKKWTNPSLNTNPLEDKDDTWTDMKKSDETYSKEKVKRSFDAELFKCGKKLKNAPKSMERKLNGSIDQMEIQTKTDSKNLKFTGKIVQSIADEESYEYIESDSSYDKFYHPAENMRRVPQLVQQFEIKEDISKEDSRRLVAAKKDSSSELFKLYSSGNRNYSSENTFELNKCISIEHIDLNAKLKENSANEQDEKDDLKISQNKKTKSITENYLNQLNVNDDLSKSNCIIKKNYSNDDLMLFGTDLNQKIVTSLEPTNQTMNSTNIENISFDQTAEMGPSKDFEKSTTSSNRKISTHTKDTKCSHEIKTNPTKNNLPKNYRKKSPQAKMLKNTLLLKSNLVEIEQKCLSSHKNNLLHPQKCKNKSPQSKISNDEHFLKSKQSQKQYKNFSTPRGNSLSNKNVKNIQEEKLDLSTNKNNISSSRKKLTGIKNVTNSKVVNIHDSPNRNKYQYIENKMKIPDSKDSNDTKKVKIKSAHCKNIVSLNCKKNATSIKIPKKAKSPPQNDNKRVNKPPPSSKILCDDDGGKFSSSQRKSNKNLDQETKSANNSKKIDKNNSAVKNRVKIQLCKTQKHISSAKELSEKSEGSDVSKNTRRKGISNRQPFLQATNVLTDASETKIIPPKNTANVNIIEKENFLIFSQQNINSVKTLVEEISPTVLSKLTEGEMIEKQCSSDISPENSRNAKYLKEEHYIIKDTEFMKMTEEFLPEPAEHAKTLKHENSDFISSIPSNDIEKVNTIKEELFAIIQPKDTKSENLMRRKYAVTAARYAENAEDSKEKFSVIPKEDIESEKTPEDGSSSIISSENIETLQNLEKCLFATSLKNTETKKPLEKANPKSLQVVEEGFLDIPSKITRNEKTFKDENSSIISSDIIENLQILGEENFPAIPLENRENEKILKSPFDILSKNTVTAKEINEESPLPKEDRIEDLPKKHSKKKKAETRTFTNLPIRRVQKILFRLKEMKTEVPKTNDIKPEENHTCKEIKQKTQLFSDKMNTKFDDGFTNEICKTKYVACTSKDDNRPRDMINSTKGYKSKISKKRVKTKKME